MSRPRPSNPFDFSQEDHDLFRDIQHDIAQSLIDEPLDLGEYLASPEELARVELLFPPAPAPGAGTMKLTVYGRAIQSGARHDASGTWTVHTARETE